MTKTMNDILGLDEAKCREIVAIKEKYIKGELTFEEAREIILQRFDSVTPQEFAFGEQMLKDDGIDDETMLLCLRISKKESLLLMDMETLVP